MHEEEYFEKLIDSRIDRMGELGEDDPSYTSTLHLLKDLLNTSSARVLEHLIKKVTETPLSEFKIEVITNNAEKIANNLYASFKVPATEGMLDEILGLLGQEALTNRLGLLIYCLEQVSIKLNARNKNAYLEMLVK
jgi:hypothetical protein